MPKVSLFKMIVYQIYILGIYWKPVLRPIMPQRLWVWMDLRLDWPIFKYLIREDLTLRQSFKNWWGLN